VELPHCDELFDRFCRPFYGQDDLNRRVYKSTRPDTETSWKPGTPVARIQWVAQEWQKKIEDQLATMLKSAEGDWRSYLELDDDDFPSLGSVEKFDNYYDRSAIRAVIERSDPAEYTNDYLVICIQFAAVLGAVLRQEFPRLEVLYDWPYWETAVYDPVTGTRINVFDWAVKKMSEYGVDDGFREKVLACIELLKREFKE
jgi:hypothetical protein